MEDGKIHFVQNLAKHPESGVFLYRFSYRGRVYTGSTRCYRLNEARDFINALKGRLSLDGVGIKLPKIVSLRHCFDAWLKERGPQRSPKYVRTMKVLVNGHVLPVIGGFQLSQVDTTAISTVMNKYLQTHTRAGTNTLALSIGSLLGFAVEKGWLAEKPIIQLVPVQRVHRPVVPPDTLTQFLEAVDIQGSLHASFLIRVQLFMGMRNHEARLMKWSGLRLDQKVFIPDKTKNGDAPTMPVPVLIGSLFPQARDGI